MLGGGGGGSGLGAALGALWNRGGGGGAAAAAAAAAAGASGAAAGPSAAAASSSVFGAQPLYQLGMAREEVKARLAPVPVYTVANPKNEFVLVAGEVRRSLPCCSVKASPLSAPARPPFLACAPLTTPSSANQQKIQQNNTQLGFFFFRKEDAEAIVEKIREENPRLARDSKVLRVTMDNVFDVFTTPRDQTGLAGIHFRFMPDAGQVRRALRLHREAGLPTAAFVGVPVFQAEGLTVTAADAQYVPLFLAGEDLEAAVGAAHRARHAPQIAALRDRAAAAQAEYELAARAAEAAAVAAGGGKSSGAARAAENRAAKARAKAEGARARAAEAEAAPAPKVEVGSLEEVIARMAASEGGELAAWSQVMIVAPGLLLKQQEQQQKQQRQQQQESADRADRAAAAAAAAAAK